MFVKSIADPLTSPCLLCKRFLLRVLRDRSMIRLKPSCVLKGERDRGDTGVAESGKERPAKMVDAAGIRK